MSHEAADTANQRRVLELLPWYVNGTLTGAELEEVRHALRSSLSLRREHDRLVRVQRLMQQDEAEHIATDRSFERLMSRIHRRRLWDSRALWPAAAALAAVGIGLALWMNAAPPGAPFETLTTREASATGAPRLRVVFAAGVTPEMRNTLLDAHGLVAVSPPTPEGVYTLTLPAGADARAVAQALRADPRIRFASTPPADER